MEISCSKCLENITEDSEFSTTHCGHTFHTRCILSWLRTNEECSECGKPCTNEQVYRIYPNKSTDNKENTEENKMITTLLENVSIKSTDLPNLLQSGIQFDAFTDTYFSNTCHTY